MRFLHTSDWHLGRTIKGKSRQDEFARVVLEVVDIAIRERVDAVLIAGDTFDAFSPPHDAEKLLYEALAQLLGAGIRVAMIAGNHDAAPHMDALSGVLQLAGIHAVGSVPLRMEDSTIMLPSRDGSETATIAALPWVPERLAIDYSTLFDGPEEAMKQYSGRLEQAIAHVCEAFSPATINIFMGHMLLEGAEIPAEGGERKLHIGSNFAVQSASLPSTAQYVALGHVHRSQKIAGPGERHYAGSLLQLDFGEGGQEKYVNIVDAHPKLPAQVERIAMTGGKQLRTLRLPLADLDQHAGAHADDYLRVIVQLDAHVVALYDRVRVLMPNAVEVSTEMIGELAASSTAAERRGLAPHELFTRFYAERRGGEAPAALLAAFNELYEEAEFAPA